jgi:hypothetical protein
MLLASDPAVTTGRRVLFLIELEPLLQSLFAAGGGGAEAEFSAAMCADQEVGVKVVRAVMAQAIGILKKWKSGHHLLGKGQIEDLRKWFGLETVP